MMRDAVRLVVGMLPFAAMASGAAHEIVTLIFGASFAPVEPFLAWLIFGKVAAVMISIAVVIMIVANRPGLSFALESGTATTMRRGRWRLCEERHGSCRTKENDGG